ncbi:winged helix-turn-helix domain-containing protein [Promicromonospora soli]
MDQHVRRRVGHLVRRRYWRACRPALREILGISQSTCSHHVRKLAEVGFVQVHKERTATLVTINTACLPSAVASGATPSSWNAAAP